MLRMVFSIDFSRGGVAVPLFGDGGQNIRSAIVRATGDGRIGASSEPVQIAGKTQGNQFNFAPRLADEERHIMWLGLVLSLAMPTGATPTGTAPSPTVTVIATDYAFQMPDTLPAGETTFRVENRGRELHHLYLARLGGGKRAADLVAAMKAGGPPPAWSTDVGGPNGADPGTTSLAATVPLTPGHYAALCIIPGPDGVPHVMKGMYKDLVVTPSTRPVSLTHDKTSATITLTDYAFQSTRPLTAGVHRVLVRNAGKQTHELELVRLLPGKTPADLAAWAEKMAGPPPAHFLGGVSPIGPGHDNELTLKLTPGHYVMLCFVPDAKDGKPHVAHGMVHDFVIK
jgi:uncharacterized cupredoxin-like copper-binding protein